MKDSDAALRLAAAVALTRIDPHYSGTAVTVLHALKNHPEPFIQISAAAALWQLNPIYPCPIPRLINLVEQSHGKTVWAVELLGDLGPGAKEAIPALLRLFQSGSVAERRRVATAVRKIDPDTAVRFGFPGTLAIP